MHVPLTRGHMSFFFFRKGKPQWIPLLLSVVLSEFSKLASTMHGQV